MDITSSETVEWKEIVEKIEKKEINSEKFETDYVSQGEAKTWDTYGARNKLLLGFFRENYLVQNSKIDDLMVKLLFD